MTKPTIVQMLEFINRFSTEPVLGWIIPHLYDLEEYEIQWLYDRSTTLNWYVKQKSADVWNNVTATQLEQYLIDEKADLNHFEFEILKIICVQAVCAHYYVEKAGKLVGKEKIEAAIKLMYEVLEDKKTTKIPKLRLVKKKKKDE